LYKKNIEKNLAKSFLFFKEKTSEKKKSIEAWAGGGGGGHFL